MNIDLNSFLLATSMALDMAEEEILNISVNHTKRCAYISLRIGKKMGLSKDACFDLCSLSLLHDNGIMQAVYAQGTDDLSDLKTNLEKFERFTDHCIIGNENVKGFPFLTDTSDVILYHHEYIDGSGVFGLKGDAIPLMSQIISFVDDLDMYFELDKIDEKGIEEVRKFALMGYGKWYSEELVETFLDLSTNLSFWEHLKNDVVIDAITFYLPKIQKQLSPRELLKISAVFSNIIDAKSKFTAEHSLDLMKKAAAVSEYLNWDESKSISFQISASLHDLGKLMIPNRLLDKSEPLTEEEFQTIRAHVKGTYEILNQIHGMEKILKWAAYHHERIDGSGYPFGLTDEQLCFESQLMAALDMYQALTENRPYRKPYSHDKAMHILHTEVEKRRFHQHVIDVIEHVFYQFSLPGSSL